MWSANSADLNPVYIWGVTRQRAYQVSIQDKDELRQRFVEMWAECQYSEVDYVIDQWVAKKTARVVCPCERVSFNSSYDVIEIPFANNMTTGCFQSDPIIGETILL